MLTPEDQSSLQLLRSRILAKEQIPPADLAKAITLLRADRLSAASRSTASKAKRASTAKAPARPAAELLGKLGIPGL